MLYIREYHRLQYPSFVNWKSRSAKPSQHQTTVKEYIPTKLSAEQLQSFRRYLAMHYYVTGTAFERVECPYLAKAISIINSTVQIPSRTDLSGSLLDSCYTDVKEKVDSWIKLPRTIVSLTTDGWSNVLQDGIVNYMLTNSSRCVFYEAVETKKQRHNKEWLAQDISRVISSVDCFVAGVVTDNTAANKAAWEILLKMSGPIFVYLLSVSSILCAPVLHLKEIFPQ